MTAKNCLETHGKLKDDFPILKHLIDSEVDSAVARGGLFKAFLRAHVRQLSGPQKVGRPTTGPKFKPVIQRRGRKSAAPLSPNSTNIQLAALAKAYMECMHCSGTRAAEQTLLAITGVCRAADKRRLARLISELPGRAHDMRARRGTKSQPVENVVPDLSLAGMLNHYAAKSK